MRHDSVENQWDKNAKIWQEASAQGFDVWRDYLNTPAFLDMLPDLATAEGLDIGCGEGHNSRLIAQRCKFLTAVDISQRFIDGNQQQTNPTNISFQKANAVALPFPNNHFDFVVSTMSFMDMAELEKAFTEINRVLKPTGFLQFSIIHPCFNEHKGRWIQDETGQMFGFIMKDYFKETHGEIHEWQHLNSPPGMPKFQVPRFWKPLHKWLNALVNAGFTLEKVCEPYPNAAALREHPELQTSTIVAHSLIIRVKKNKNTTQRLQKILENLPGNVWWKDKNLVYLGCNEQVLQVLGLTSSQELIGKTDHDLWPKAIADKLREADIHVLATGEATNLEEAIVQSDGSEVVMLTNKSPLYDDENNIIGILGTSTDITERKKMESELRTAKEAAEAANTAKARFLANITHDIKTPLTGVISTAEYLAHVLDNSDYKSRAEDIMQSGLILLELLNEVLELTRLEVVNKNNVKNVFKLRQLVDDLVKLIKPAVENKKLQFSLQYDENIQQHLTSNRWYLYRILLNLLANAIKFTQQGSITFAVFTERETTADIQIKFVISDTGIGIPKDQQAVIFEQFTRLSPSYQGLYRGCGLGLYLVKQFTEYLNGKITVQSEENQGCTISCSIPFKKTFVTPLSKKVSSAKEGMTSVDKLEQKILILLVEDNPIAAKAAQNILQSLGCEVDIAHTGKEAIALFKKQPHDLIYLDIGLPDQSGEEVAKEIRSLECGSNKRTPIIALSAHLPGTGLLNPIAGVDATLSKPLLREQAREMLLKYGLFRY